MTIYIIYILMTFILSLFYDQTEEYSGKKRFWYRFTCLFLILIAGLRNGVGGDTQAYMSYFEDAPTNPADYDMYIEQMQLIGGYMPGWTFFTLLCKRWFDSFYVVQFIQALIVNTCFFYIFRQYTTRIFLCALLYGITGQFFNFNTEVMREGIAVGLCLVGMHQYLQGKKKWFYILVVCSLFFHISALIAFLFPFVNFKKISFKKLIIAFIISFGIWAISDSIVSTITKHIMGDEGIADKLLLYSNQKSSIFGFLLLALQYFVIQGGITYFAQKGREDDEEWMKKYNRFISFYLVIAIIACGISGFTRLLNYTMPIYIILLAEFLGDLSQSMRYFAVTKLILVAGFIWSMHFFYMYYYPETERRHYEFFVPYTSVFDENADNTYRYNMYVEAVTPQTQDAKNTRDF